MLTKVRGAKTDMGLVKWGLIGILLMLMAVLLFKSGAQPAGAQQTLYPVSVDVISARSEPDAPGGPVLVGDPITDYLYMINIDNTGDPSQERFSGCHPDDVGYPDSCHWPSLREVPSHAPIFTQGDQSDFAGGATLNLPPGKYLISILADGYKMSGAHFVVSDAGVDVLVEAHPHPLPSSTMRIKVFEDISPVNGQFDAPAEQGMAGFAAAVKDIGGDVTTDVFGNPMCTIYDTNGEPMGLQIDGCLVSDANGDITIPNLGTHRYDVEVIAPDGEVWLQTTTLEGSLAWDTWLAEGGTGLDNEFVVAGEPFPWTMFGFVQPTDQLNDASVTGGLSGTIVKASIYLPQQNGLPFFGDRWTGFSGTQVTGPLERGWVALSSLEVGDTSVYIGEANPDGTFLIENVPDGNYIFTFWDEIHHYILDWTQVTVENGEIYDMGTPMVVGWFTRVEGYVFDDINMNGKMDPGEHGIHGYPISYRDRDNSEIDRMSVAVTTDETGYYVFERAYPMNSWMVLEAYNDRYYSTGFTFQTQNQPDETTVLGDGVDIGLLPVLGQSARLDWGVRPYARFTNGGIVGTVTYDVTRAEYDPQYAGHEPWQPGIGGLTVNLYETVFCGTNPGAPCDEIGLYELDTDGSYKKGPLMESQVNETWTQPTDCIARDANGDPLRYGIDQGVIPADPTGKRCIEAPLTGTQVQAGYSPLDGNYGFVGMPAGDYLVEVEIPTDSLGRPMYKFSQEEDINVFNGDQFVEQVPPPACAGALRTIDVADSGLDNYPATNLTYFDFNFQPVSVSVPASSPVVNPTFAENGGSPYEGTQRRSCDTKLVTVSNGKSIAPTFFLFTDVPLPGRWKGYIIDDLTISTDINSMWFGEKNGIDNMPVGVYDFSNRLVTTATSDPNGVFEILLPSTHSVNCPSPSGMCPSMYYLLGNDPGQPGQLNANYNPQYRTIGATFEIYPGLLHPSDLAPTQMVPGILAGGTQYNLPPQCTLDAETPQLFAVDTPYHNNNSSTGLITVEGQGFGAAQGLVTFTDKNGNATAMPVNSWTENEIRFEVSPAMARGPYQLDITSAQGVESVNGLTFHVVGSGYNFRFYEVGPGRQYATIQSAIDAAGSRNNAMVVVYPGAPEQWNPTGSYFENIIIDDRITLQGVGPGGVRADNTYVLGSVIDGRGVSGDTIYASEWRNKALSLDWDGNQAIYEGAVVYVVTRGGNTNGEFGSANPNNVHKYRATIDGFKITGGDQQGFPNNLTPGDPSTQTAVAVQGGGIFVNGYARHLKISNNVIESNGGAYGGGIRLGTPHLQAPYTDAQNDNIVIDSNRIIANGGTNLAGAVAIFNGADNYQVTNNDICGNFSVEYGGGISHYGYSPNGTIADNRVYFNRSYDEGGGIMIAGELPADPFTLSAGAGPVTVYNNLIQANLSNDDGGGLRYLMAGDFPYVIYNNMIVNNIATHEGGGVSFNDTPDVTFFNNTVMSNITTATAVTSNGAPAPAGLATSRHSDLLLDTLPASAPIFGDPLMYNNIFWNNRSGRFTGGTVAGIGLDGDPNPIKYWDMGVADGSGDLAPIHTMMLNDDGTIANATNRVGVDPQVVAPFDTSVSVLPWRGNPHFVDVLLVTTSASPNEMGDYHIQETSPAIDLGTAAGAPDVDIDNHPRPTGITIDVGADEYWVPPIAIAGAVLDTFELQGGGSVGAAWRGSKSTKKFVVTDGTVTVRKNGFLIWKEGVFGPNQEVFFTFSQVSPVADQQALILKSNNKRPDAKNARQIMVVYNHVGGSVEIWTKEKKQDWVLHELFPAQFADGDTFRATAEANGMVTVYKNTDVLGSHNVLTGPNAWNPAYMEAGGRVGVQFSTDKELLPNNIEFDNFGAGTLE